MKNKDELRKELENIARDFPEPLKYKVPEGYFEQTPDRILSRWRTSQRTPLYTLPTLRRMIAAAAVVGGIAIGIVWLSPQTGDTHIVQSIPSEDAYQYILDHMDEFESLIQEVPVIAEEVPLEDQDMNAVEEYLLDEMESEDIESFF